MLCPLSQDTQIPVNVNSRSNETPAVFYSRELNFVVVFISSDNIVDALNELIKTWYANIEKLDFRRKLYSRNEDRVTPNEILNSSRQLHFCWFRAVLRWR